MKRIILTCTTSLLILILLFSVILPANAEMIERVKLLHYEDGDNILDAVLPLEDGGYLLSGRMPDKSEPTDTAIWMVQCSPDDSWAVRKKVLCAPPGQNQVVAMAQAGSRYLLLLKSLAANTYAAVLVDRDGFGEVTIPELIDVNITTYCRADQGLVLGGCRYLEGGQEAPWAALIGENGQIFWEYEGEPEHDSLYYEYNRFAFAAAESAYIILAQQKMKWPSRETQQFLLIIDSLGNLLHEEELALSGVLAGLAIRKERVALATSSDGKMSLNGFNLEGTSLWERSWEKQSIAEKTLISTEEGYSFIGDTMNGDTCLISLDIDGVALEQVVIYPFYPTFQARFFPVYKDKTWLIAPRTDSYSSQNKAVSRKVIN